MNKTDIVRTGVITQSVQAMLELVPDGQSIQIPHRYLEHFYLDALLSATNSVILVQDVVQGRLVYASPNACELTGVDNDTFMREWPGIVEDWIPQHLQNDVLEMMQQHVIPFVQNFKLDDGIKIMNLIFVLHLPDGSEKWVHQRIIPTSWTEDYRALAGILYLTDITHLPFDKKITCFETQLKPGDELSMLFGANSLMNELHISKKEFEVLRALARGLSRAEIADAMCVSVNTVDKHRKNLMKKMQVTNKAQLVTVAQRYHIL